MFNVYRYTPLFFSTNFLLFLLFLLLTESEILAVLKKNEK